MPTTSTFNWSNLDRYYLYELLNEIRAKVVGKELLIHDFHLIVAKHLRSNLPIRVSKKFNPTVKNGEIWVGGVYYADKDEDYYKAIEVNFNYHPKVEKIKVTSYRWKRLCLLFADTLLHEIIHMRQYRIRNFEQSLDYPSTAECAKQRADQGYYGNRDEIDAYGFNLACELYDRFGTNYNQAIDYLENGNHKQNKRSIFYAYLKAFDFDTEHQVIKRLKTRALRYFPYAIIGKPFKTPTWLYS